MQCWGGGGRDRAHAVHVAWLESCAFLYYTRHIVYFCASYMHMPMRHLTPRPPLLNAQARSSDGRLKSDGARTAAPIPMAAPSRLRSASPSHAVALSPVRAPVTRGFPFIRIALKQKARTNTLVIGDIAKGGYVVIIGGDYGFSGVRNFAQMSKDPHARSRRW